jgi:hypothetical protein
LNAENALNKDNFENFLASSLFPEDDKKWWFDIFRWRDNKENWSRIPYYVFDYVSLLDK